MRTVVRWTRLSGGRVAYIYLPDTGAEGLAAFDRYFFAQADKEAVIIDERDNGGGALADYIINRLGQRIMALRTAQRGAGWHVAVQRYRGAQGDDHE